jgi:hypothetical protein
MFASGGWFLIHPRFASMKLRSVGAPLMAGASFLERYHLQSVKPREMSGPKSILGSMITAWIGR